MFDNPVVNELRQRMVSLVIKLLFVEMGYFDYKVLYVLDEMENYIFFA